MFNTCIKIDKWAIFEGEMFFSTQTYFSKASKWAFILPEFSPRFAFTCFEEGSVWRKEGELKSEKLWSFKNSLFKVFLQDGGLQKLPLGVLWPVGLNEVLRVSKEEKIVMPARWEEKTPWKEQENPQHPEWSWCTTLREGTFLHTIRAAPTSVREDRALVWHIIFCCPYFLFIFL